MSLLDKKINTYANPVSNLPDHPSSEGWTAAALKAAFDANANNEIKNAINGIIDVLLAVTDGASGADNIGATAIKTDGATKVQLILEQLQADKIGKADDETIDGKKNFTKSPVIPYPVADNEAATKKYIEDRINSTAGIGDAVKLGGQLPEYYAPAVHLSNFVTDINGVHGLKIESGTFTPYIFGKTTAGVNTYNAQYGYYYNIGKRVYFDVYIQMSTKDVTMSGELKIGGLPFVPINNTLRRMAITIGRLDSLNYGTAKSIAGFISPLEPYISLIKILDNAGILQVLASDIGNLIICVSGNYLIV